MYNTVTMVSNGCYNESSSSSISSSSSPRRCSTHSSCDQSCVSYYSTRQIQDINNYNNDPILHCRNTTSSVTSETACSSSTTCTSNDRSSCATSNISYSTTTTDSTTSTGNCNSPFTYHYRNQYHPTRQLKQQERRRLRPLRRSHKQQQQQRLIASMVAIAFVLIVRLTTRPIVVLSFLHSTKRLSSNVGSSSSSSSDSNNDSNIIKHKTITDMMLMRKCTKNANDYNINSNTHKWNLHASTTSSSSLSFMYGSSDELSNGIDSATAAAAASTVDSTPRTTTDSSRKTGDFSTSTSTGNTNAVATTNLYNNDWISIPENIDFDDNVISPSTTMTTTPATTNVERNIKNDNMHSNNSTTKLLSLQEIADLLVQQQNQIQQLQQHILEQQTLQQQQEENNDDRSVLTTSTTSAVQTPKIQPSVEQFNKLLRNGQSNNLNPGSTSTRTMIDPLLIDNNVVTESRQVEKKYSNNNNDNNDDDDDDSKKKKNNDDDDDNDAADNIASVDMQVNTVLQEILEANQYRSGTITNAGTNTVIPNLLNDETTNSSTTVTSEIDVATAVLDAIAIAEKAIENAELAVAAASEASTKLLPSKRKQQYQQQQGKKDVESSSSSSSSPSLLLSSTILSESSSYYGSSNDNIRQQLLVQRDEKKQQQPNQFVSLFVNKFVTTLVDATTNLWTLKDSIPNELLLNQAQERPSELKLMSRNDGTKSSSPSSLTLVSEKAKGIDFFLVAEDDNSRSNDKSNIVYSAVKELSTPILQDIEDKLTMSSIATTITEFTDRIYKASLQLTASVIDTVTAVTTPAAVSSNDTTKTNSASTDKSDIVKKNFTVPDFVVQGSVLNAIVLLAYLNQNNVVVSHDIGESIRLLVTVPIIVSYLTFTQGTIGQTLRTLGGLTWNITESIAELSAEYVGPVASSVLSSVITLVPNITDSLSTVSTNMINVFETQSNDMLENNQKRQQQVLSASSLDDDIVLSDSAASKSQLLVADVDTFVSKSDILPTAAEVSVLNLKDFSVDDYNDEDDSKTQVLSSIQDTSIPSFYFASFQTVTKEVKAEKTTTTTTTPVVPVTSKLDKQEVEVLNVETTTTAATSAATSMTIAKQDSSSTTSTIETETTLPVPSAIDLERVMEEEILIASPLSNEESIINVEPRVVEAVMDEPATVTIIEYQDIIDSTLAESKNDDMLLIEEDVRRLEKIYDNLEKIRVDLSMEENATIPGITFDPTTDVDTLTLVNPLEINSNIVLDAPTVDIKGDEKQDFDAGTFFADLIVQEVGVEAAKMNVEEDVVDNILPTGSAVTSASENLLDLIRRLRGASDVVSPPIVADLYESGIRTSTTIQQIDQIESSSVPLDTTNTFATWDQYQQSLSYVGTSLQNMLNQLRSSGTALIGSMSEALNIDTTQAIAVGKVNSSDLQILDNIDVAVEEIALPTSIIEDVSQVIDPIPALANDVSQAVDPIPALANDIDVATNEQIDVSTAFEADKVQEEMDVAKQRALEQELLVIHVNQATIQDEVNSQVHMNTILEEVEAGVEDAQIIKHDQSIESEITTSQKYDDAWYESVNQILDIHNEMISDLSREETTQSSNYEISEIEDTIAELSNTGRITEELITAENIPDEIQAFTTDTLHEAQSIVEDNVTDDSVNATAISEINIVNIDEWHTTDDTNKDEASEDIVRLYGVLGQLSSTATIESDGQKIMDVADYMIEESDGSARLQVITPADMVDQVTLQSNDTVDIKDSVSVFESSEIEVKEDAQSALDAIEVDLRENTNESSQPIPDLTTALESSEVEVKDDAQSALDTDEVDLTAYTKESLLPILDLVTAVESSEVEVKDDAQATLDAIEVDLKEYIEESSQLRPDLITALESSEVEAIDDAQSTLDTNEVALTEYTKESLQPIPDHITALESGEVEVKDDTQSTLDTNEVDLREFTKESLQPRRDLVSLIDRLRKDVTTKSLKSVIDQTQSTHNRQSDTPLRIKTAVSLDSRKSFSISATKPVEPKILVAPTTSLYRLVNALRSGLSPPIPGTEQTADTEATTSLTFADNVLVPESLDLDHADYDERVSISPAIDTLEADQVSKLNDDAFLTTSYRRNVSDEFDGTTTELIHKSNHFDTDNPHPETSESISLGIDEQVAKGKDLRELITQLRTNTMSYGDKPEVTVLTSKQPVATVQQQMVRAKDNEHGIFSMLPKLMSAVTPLRNLIDNLRIQPDRQEYLTELTSVKLGVVAPAPLNVEKLEYADGIDTNPTDAIPTTEPVELPVGQPVDLPVDQHEATATMRSLPTMATNVYQIATESIADIDVLDLKENGEGMIEETSKMDFDAVVHTETDCLGSLIDRLRNDVVADDVSRNITNILVDMDVRNEENIVTIKDGKSSEFKPSMVSRSFGGTLGTLISRLRNATESVVNEDMTNESVRHPITSGTTRDASDNHVTANMPQDYISVGSKERMYGRDTTTITTNSVIDSGPVSVNYLTSLLSNDQSLTTSATPSMDVANDRDESSEYANYVKEFNDAQRLSSDTNQDPEGTVMRSDLYEIANGSVDKYSNGISAVDLSSSTIDEEGLDAAVVKAMETVDVLTARMQRLLERLQLEPEPGIE